MDRRAAAFARLFEAVHEGVYIGTVGAESSTTIAANPHLKLIFGYPGDASEHEVRFFDRDRFVDPQARVALLDRLSNDGSVNDYLLRLRRADDDPVWVELTARSEPVESDGVERAVELRRSSEMSASGKSWMTKRATSIISCCRPRRWPHWGRRSPASPTN